MDDSPITEFKTDAEAVECLKEWQQRLYLTDWIFRVFLVDQSALPNECAHNEIRYSNKASKILIAKKNEDNSDVMIKFCHEVSLVHELLHCKYNWLQDDGSYEGKYVDVQEHALVEQMARSLIMAKYNLTPDWFDNRGEDIGR